MELLKANYKTILFVHTGAAIWGGTMGNQAYKTYLTNAYGVGGHIIYHRSNRDRLFEIIEGSLTGIAMLYSLPLIIPIGSLCVLDKIREKTK